MFLEFFRTKEKTITRDEKGIQPKETHDKIEEELSLENEIEILEENIAYLCQKKEELGTVQENKKNKKGYIIWVLVLFLITLSLSKLIPLLLGIQDSAISNPRFHFIHTYSDVLLFAMIPTSLMLLLPIFVPEVLKFNKNIKKILEIDEQIAFLNNELSQKKTELEEIRRDSKKENINDPTIHSLDSSKYRASLEERLNLLSYIKKYHKELKSYLEDGTLTEELRELEIDPENISFAEETLKRVLEKEKVTQHE